MVVGEVDGADVDCTAFMPAASCTRSTARAASSVAVTEARRAAARAQAARALYQALGFQASDEPGEVSTDGTPRVVFVWYSAA